MVLQQEKSDFVTSLLLLLLFAAIIRRHGSFTISLSVIILCLTSRISHCWTIHFLPILRNGRNRPYGAKHSSEQIMPRTRRGYIPDAMMISSLSSTSTSTSTSLPTFAKQHMVDTTSTTSGDDNNDDNNKNDDDDEQLLLDWMTHSTFEFHKFNNDDAANIRLSLLTWYRRNRRKLPWRGDPPPFDGSTAGINNNNNNNNNKKKNSHNSKNKKTAKPQTNKITHFFESNTTAGNKTNETTMIKSTTAIKKESTKSKIPSPSLSSLSSSSLLENAIPLSAYGIWVSEIMLQQTRVEAVIPYWIRWMTSFPTVHELAMASEDQVNAHWAGLGFYRRARLLHQGAKFVVHEYNGTVPGTVDELLTIPGIGPYTASAIASIAYDVCVPVVDGNVCRVLSRLTGIANHIKASVVKDKFGWELATQIVQAGDGTYAGEINQALMELGATYCAPSGTGIDPKDPLKEYYISTRIGKAYHSMVQQQQQQQEGRTISTVAIDHCNCPVCDSNGIQSVVDALDGRLQQEQNQTMSEDDAKHMGHTTFPLDPPKSKKREEDLAVAILSNTSRYDGQQWWLLIRRPDKGLLAGQWEFPSICVERRQEGQTNVPTPSQAKRRKALTKHLDMILVDQSWWTINNDSRTVIDPSPLEHVFSHVRHNMFLEALSLDVELSLFKWMTKEGREMRWMRESDMDQVGITSGVKKILKTVKTNQSGADDKTKKRKRKLKR